MTMMSLQIDEEVAEKRAYLNPRAPTEKQLEMLLQTVTTLLQRRCPDKPISSMRLCMVMTGRGKIKPEPDCECHDACKELSHEVDSNVCLAPSCKHHSYNCSSRVFVRLEKRKNGSFRRVFQQNGGPQVWLLVNGFHMATWLTQADKFDINFLADEVQDIADIIEYRLTGSWRFHDENGDRRVVLNLPREPGPTEY